MSSVLMLVLALVFLPLSCATGICVLLWVRPNASLAEAAEALSDTLRAVLGRERAQKESAEQSHV